MSQRDDVAGMHCGPGLVLQARAAPSAPLGWKEAIEAQQRADEAWIARMICATLPDDKIDAVIAELESEEPDDGNP